MSLLAASPAHLFLESVAQIFFVGVLTMQVRSASSRSALATNLVTSDTVS